MNTLRILGLDDDNHGYCWVCENGATFSTTKEVMEFLAKPHGYHVELKLFAIVDEWSDDLASYGECLVDSMFAYLENVAIRPEGMSFVEIFDLFWGSANRMHW
jgi:hypothetical protein